MDIPTTPALLAAYAELPFPPLLPRREATLMMHPNRCQSNTLHIPFIRNHISSFTGLSQPRGLKKSENRESGLTTFPLQHPFPHSSTPHHRTHKVRPQHLI